MLSVMHKGIYNQHIIISLKHQKRDFLNLNLRKQQGYLIQLIIQVIILVLDFQRIVNI